MSQESYARAARLVYISRYIVDGPKVALFQAHRLAAAAVAAHPDDDDAAVRQATRSAMYELDAWRSSKALFRGPRLTPVDITAEQREVLGRIKAVEYYAARVALLHLLEGTPIEDLADLLGDERLDHHTETVREGVATLCAGREPEEIRALLLARELDPVVVPVSAPAVLKRRRRRIRAGSIATAVAVVLAGAGVWWFAIRVPPLGTYANDPQIQTQALIHQGGDGVDAWQARGELLGDTALLRRAADGWREKGLPSGARPRVLFAGSVQAVRVVVMTGEPGLSTDSFSVAVYVENLKNVKSQFVSEDSDRQIRVNPIGAPDSSGPGAIRLLDSRTYFLDPILLPPTVSDVETGLLDTPQTGWKAAQPDARGVIEVPIAKQNYDPPSSRPSQGIRFKESDDNVLIGSSTVTVPETFPDGTPVLPAIGSDLLGDQVFTDAVRCAISKQAQESDDGEVGYSSEILTEVAGGPLPDGGGTGDIISRRGYGPRPTPFSDIALLTRTGPSCDTATLLSDSSMSMYAAEDDTYTDGGSVTSDLASAMVWTSPAKHNYLVVAAVPSVARIRVSGPLTASADGRWLVAPLGANVDRYGRPSETPLIETFDAAGHRCGDPDPQVAGGQYCYKP